MSASSVLRASPRLSLEISIAQRGLSPRRRLNLCGEPKQKTPVRGSRAFKQGRPSFDYQFRIGEASSGGVDIISMDSDGFDLEILKTLDFENTIQKSFASKRYDTTRMASFKKILKSVITLNNMASSSMQILA